MQADVAVLGAGGEGNQELLGSPGQAIQSSRWTLRESGVLGGSITGLEEWRELQQGAGREYIPLTHTILRSVLRGLISTLPLIMLVNCCYFLSDRL